MATGDQLKALIKSHYSKDQENFTTLALQLAASEARKGHGALANEIKLLVDKGKKKHLRVVPSNSPLSDLIFSSVSNKRLSQLIADQELKARIDRIINEYRQKNKLAKHGLVNRRKILLSGPPGTGKTLTASILAYELKIPFNVILIDKIVTKYMGETASKLRQIFDFIANNPGVYLFDEFDAIGTERSRDNEVGEMRRVLNAFLQFLEQDTSNSFVIAATNNISLLDQALFRRFDDVLFYHLPSEKDAQELIRNKFANFACNFNIEKLDFKQIIGLSHAEITLACEDTIKETILSNQTKIKRKIFIDMLKYRKEVYLNK